MSDVFVVKYNVICNWKFLIELSIDIKFDSTIEFFIAFRSIESLWFCKSFIYKKFRLHQWKKPIQKRIFCCIVQPQRNALSIINEYFLFAIDKTWWESRQCDSFVYSIYIFNESTYWVSCQCLEYSIPYKVFSGICKLRVLWKYLIIFWIMHTNLISTQNRFEKNYLAL